MDEERDLLVFTNEEGQEITLEVLDYFEYDDEEYALLVEADECCHDGEHDHDHEHCCEEEQEVIVMKVIVDGDTEEFVPVDDDKMSEIIEFLESADDEDMEFELEDEEDGE